MPAALLTVKDAPREIQAAVLAMKRVNRELRNEINRATRETMNPVWRGLVQANATQKMDSIVLAKGARIAAGNPPTAIAAASRRRLSGGLVPTENWQPFEFGGGGPRAKKTTYKRRSRLGNVHEVTRNTTMQLPRFDPNGRVVYPAMAEIGPRLASLWVQLIVKKIITAAEESR